MALDNKISIKNTDVAFTFGLFGVVLLLVLPVSPLFMDLLLALSIGISLFILLIVVYVKDPSEFSVFPTLLLAITLFRLGLNVASTRLILLNGYAGTVIQSFGNFVVQGNYVVGAVVFLILVVINFMVITKGAGRIAEVAARFTLDALPGKQMSIDAELNAGTIDEELAVERRSKVQKEADFYGAMDGASKFVRGDAIAGILITFINIVGGIAIGVFQRNLEIDDALHKYTLLSIGDGLVSQIPALIVSVGAGILITRTSDGVDLGENIGRQLVVYPKAVLISGIMLLVFAVFPGMPFFPFICLSVFCFWGSRVLRRLNSEGGIACSDLKEGNSEESEKVSDLKNEFNDFSEYVEVEPCAIELGASLISAFSKNGESDLRFRINELRKKFARDLGVILPLISLKDNFELKPSEYNLLIQGKIVAKGSLYPDRFLVLNPNEDIADVGSIDAQEPVFGLDAKWVNAVDKRKVENKGYAPIDPFSVLITHLSEILSKYAYTLLEREDVQKIIDRVRERHPTLVNELIPDLVNVGIVHRVLQNLLKEKVPIKNVAQIFESITDYANITKDPDELSECVRSALGVYFVSAYESEAGYVVSLVLDSSLEEDLIKCVHKSQLKKQLAILPDLGHRLISEIDLFIDKFKERGLIPVLTVSSDLRAPIRDFLSHSFNDLVILSYNEVPSATRLEKIGIISAPTPVTT